MSSRFERSIGAYDKASTSASTPASRNTDKRVKSCARVSLSRRDVAIYSMDRKQCCNCLAGRHQLASELGTVTSVSHSVYMPQKHRPPPPLKRSINGVGKKVATPHVCAQQCMRRGSCFATPPHWSTSVTTGLKSYTRRPRK